MEQPPKAVPQEYQGHERGLANLKGLKLERLHLSDTQVSDAGLEHLGGVAELWLLDLHNTRITDAGLKYVKQIAGLERLYLGSTSISDAVLKHLKKRTQLEMLDLTGTKVSEAGVHDLQKTLPNTEIFHRPTTAGKE